MWNNEKAYKGPEKLYRLILSNFHQNNFRKGTKNLEKQLFWKVFYDIVIYN